MANKTCIPKLYEDSVNRYLKSMIKQDKKGEIEAKRQEQHLDVDNIHLKLRNKKPKQTVDLW